MYPLVSAVRRNAKRFNWFAARLGTLPGWSTMPLLAKGHEEYFKLNMVTDADMLEGNSEMVVSRGKVQLDGAGFRPPGL